MIGVWVALAVALPLTFPSLSEMAQKHPLAILPGDAPSSVTAQQDDRGVPGTRQRRPAAGRADQRERAGAASDEATYRKLVDALRDDQADVVMVQDFVEHPCTATFLTSEDKKSWVLPVGLAGELGTPRSFELFNRVSDLVEPQHRGQPARGPPHRSRRHRRRPHRRG